jgi:SH3 domain protein
MFKFLRFSLSIVATLLISGLASAQTATVRRNVNLRSDPSTSVKPITLLTPPAQLTLVEPNQQNAFYHVRISDGREGWVWANNITLNPPAPTRLGPDEIYPDSAKTPGVANPDVTQDNIAENLCNPTWSTSTIRPPTSYTNPLKQNQMQQYGDTVNDPNATCVLSSNNKSCYEEDHLISLENGGILGTRGTCGPNRTTRRSMVRPSAPGKRIQSRITFTTRFALMCRDTRAMVRQRIPR